MNSNILIYQNSAGIIKIDVRSEEETVWLTQDQMATLFGKGRSTVAEHIANVFEESELEQIRTCRKFRQVRMEGRKRSITKSLMFLFLLGSRKIALKKSETEFEKYKIGQWNSENEQSLKEIEEEIKKLKKPKKWNLQRQV